jgi:hypothetical protein
LPEWSNGQLLEPRRISPVTGSWVTSACLRRVLSRRQSALQGFTGVLVAKSGEVTERFSVMVFPAGVAL